MIKKILLLCFTFSFLILAGCSGSSSAPETIGLTLPAANYSNYATADFRIQYPIDWEVLSQQEISSKFRQRLEVAFLSNFKDLFFTPVITVEKVALTENINSMEFADQNISKNASTLIDYILVDRQPVTLERKGSPVLTEIVKFRGKERIQNDILEYIQIFAVKDQSGFIVTGAYDPTANRTEEDKIVNSLKTLKLN
jgi:hypothetical protein